MLTLRVEKRKILTPQKINALSLLLVADRIVSEAGSAETQGQ